MNNLSNNITGYLDKIKKHSEIEYKNFRDELVKKTVARLRKEREGTQYEIKIVSERWIAILFNKKYKGNNYDLYIFLTKCNNSNNFTACFWSGIK